MGQAEAGAPGPPAGPSVPALRAPPAVPPVAYALLTCVCPFGNHHPGAHASQVPPSCFCLKAASHRAGVRLPLNLPPLRPATGQVTGERASPPAPGTGHGLVSGTGVGPTEREPTSVKQRFSVWGGQEGLPGDSRPDQESGPGRFASKCPVGDGTWVTVNPGRQPPTDRRVKPSKRPLVLQAERQGGGTSRGTS